MKHLQSAAERGLTGAEPVRKDPDLKALRERDDFKQLLRELEEKGRP
jgi:hypothetical protein